MMDLGTGKLKELEFDPVGQRTGGAANRWGSEPMGQRTGGAGPDRWVAGPDPGSLPSPREPLDCGSGDRGAGEWALQPGRGFP